MILMIDNYDSFTFNIVQYMSELGATLKVVRNDEISPQQIRDLNPEKIVVSPGPCTPNEAGISVDVIKEFHSSIPILGVCLGHQSIAQAFGGKIVRAKKVMHGKVSQIHHNNTGVFDNLDQDFTATRYHSLVVERHSLPSCFEVTAWTYDEANDFDEIMGIRHRDFPVEGVQFHPESILTEHGHLLFKNFLENKV
ncbi:MAG: aminodeoxychorismate/anthranilate synthase component II [SAR92 clade bacterium]|jgi:anthranilate synthase component 2|uniref:Aminodeoxychorismate/anthranilate synthase component II n=1 Tax=SAR92 clade bacterium TaxID=2315479 RepID=A0A520LPI8_9GAMM|nr:anthranilate/aminodeoxychorismate synthase component II [Gammaproteobacteria bacterium]RZO08897.1 MAG: aminodeoxychorismate/anthranilate synthase component II [SAR92 clade bacterium]